MIASENLQRHEPTMEEIVAVDPLVPGNRSEGDTNDRIRASDTRRTMHSSTVHRSEAGYDDEWAPRDGWNIDAT